MSNDQNPKNDSPYIQANIIADPDLAKYADSLRRQPSRPCLRRLSRLLPKLPFHYAAIYEEESLYEWLLKKIQPATDGSPDSLLVREP